MLSITSDKPIKDIQQEFSHSFPLLKIEFSVRGSGVNNFIPKDQYLQARYSSADDGRQEVQIYVTPGITVKELKEKCEELFGVFIRVYRTFGNLWLETTMTESLTLQQQTERMSEISFSNF